MNSPPPPPPPGQNQPTSKSNFFGKTAATPMGDPHASAQFSETSRRLRMVEESLANLRRKVELDEENSLSDHKKKTVDIQTLYREVDGLKSELNRFKDQMVKMVKEFQTLAKKEDVLVLQKYIKIWEPLKYATLQQVERIVQESIGNTVNREPEEFSVPEIRNPQQTDNSLDYDNAEITGPTDDFGNPIEPTAENKASLSSTLVSEETTTTDEDDTDNTTESEHKPDTFTETHQMYADQKDSTPASKSHSQKESGEHVVSPEQKKLIAAFLEEYEDAREILLKNPDAFEQKTRTDAKLKELFQGVNITELSNKLRPHYN